MANSIQISGFTNFSNLYRIGKENFPPLHKINTLLQDIIIKFELSSKEKDEAKIATMDEEIISKLQTLSQTCEETENAIIIKEACSCTVDNGKAKELLNKPKNYLDALKQLTSPTSLKKFYEKFIKDALLTFIRENPTQTLKKMLDEAAKTQREEINALLAPPNSLSASEEKTTDNKTKPIFASIFSCFSQRHGDDSAEIKDDGWRKSLDPYDPADQDMIFGALSDNFGSIGKGFASSLCQDYLSRLDTIIENFVKNGILPQSIPHTTDVFLRRENTSFLADRKQAAYYVINIASNKSIRMRREIPRKESGALFLAPLTPAQKNELKIFYVRIYIQQAFKQALKNNFSENYISISATSAVCMLFKIEPTAIPDLENIVKIMFNDAKVKQVLHDNYFQEWNKLEKVGVEQYVQDNLVKLWNVIERMELMFPELLPTLQTSLSKKDDDVSKRDQDKDSIGTGSSLSLSGSK